MNNTGKRIKCVVTGRDCKFPTPAFITERHGYFCVSDTTYRRWCRDFGLRHPIVWVKGDPMENCDTEGTLYRGQTAVGRFSVRYAKDI